MLIFYSSKVPKLSVNDNVSNSRNQGFNSTISALSLVQAAEMYVILV